MATTACRNVRTKLTKLTKSGSAFPRDRTLFRPTAVRVTRYAPILLLNRIWQLRQNLSAHDAAYVALAEDLEAPLITRGQRIAAAPVHAATIEVF